MKAPSVSRLAFSISPVIASVGEAIHVATARSHHKDARP
jgi:hypothetical protein